MKTRRRVILVVTLVSLCLLLTACPQNTQTKVAVAMRDFSVAVKAFQQGEIALAQAGKIDPDTHKRIQGGLLHLATTAPAIDAAIQANNKAAILAAIDAGLADTDGFLTDVGAITDPNTKAEMQAIVLSIRMILANGKVLVS